MGSQPPQTRMFIQDCSPELETRIERLEARDMVMRNLLAFSAGVETTLFWDVRHSTSRRDDIMHLMFSKLKLMEFEESGFAKRRPLADAFERMAKTLHGLQSVRRIAPKTDSSVFFFEVSREGSGPLYVIWQRRDAFSGEEARATPFEMDWKEPTWAMVDALGVVPPFTAISLCCFRTPQCS
jgi:hypothetical protein